MLRNYRKDGSPFWNELSITPVYNDADQLTYYIGIQHDVSDKMAALERIESLETEVAELRRQLARLDG
ncbi:Blue-light-activated histidine kinase 1 [compost metagenome]